MLDNLIEKQYKVLWKHEYNTYVSTEEKVVFIIFIGRENELKNLNELYQQNMISILLRIISGRKKQSLHSANGKIN